MRGGQLDRSVAVQRAVSSQSDSGQPIDTWSTIGSINRWAMRLPVLGNERFTADQFAALEQVEFRLRWDDDLANLQPKDRIIEPAEDASSSPVPMRSIYEVIAVHEIGRREGLRVITTRRADVS